MAGRGKGKTGQPVERPLKRSEYAIVFVTHDAIKGWTDCLSQFRNATVDAWEFLTRTPEVSLGRVYQMKGDLATFVHQGTSYPRLQYKLSDGSRLWYGIRPSAGQRAKTKGEVLLYACRPGHP